MLTDLYEEYETYLQHYALKLVQDVQQAEDLVQDAFIRAMGHLDLLALLNPHQRRAWLSKTLKNLFLDAQRAQQRQATLLQYMALDDLHAAPTELMIPNPFDLAPERYRELVTMRYSLGMTSQEIARELEIPAATVRSRLHLALKEIRRHQTKLQ